MNPDADEGGNSFANPLAALTLDRTARTGAARASFEVFID